MMSTTMSIHEIITNIKHLPSTNRNKSTMTSSNKSNRPWLTRSYVFSSSIKLITYAFLTRSQYPSEISNHNTKQ